MPLQLLSYQGYHRASPPLLSLANSHRMTGRVRTAARTANDNTKAAADKAAPAVAVKAEAVVATRASDRITTTNEAAGARANLLRRYNLPSIYIL